MNIGSQKILEQNIANEYRHDNEEEIEKVTDKLDSLEENGQDKLANSDNKHDLQESDTDADSDEELDIFNENTNKIASSIESLVSLQKISKMVSMKQN